MTRKQKALATVVLLLIGIVGPIAGAFYDLATGGCCGSSEPVSTDGIFFGGFVTVASVIGVVVVWQQRPPRDRPPRT